MGFPSGSVVKNLPTNAVDTGDEGSTLELGRSPEAGNSLQYSWQENPIGRGAWWVTVHRVAKSQTWQTEHICTCVCIHTYIHTYSYTIWGYCDCNMEDHSRTIYLQIYNFIKMVYTRVGILSQNWTHQLLELHEPWPAQVTITFWTSKQTVHFIMSNTVTCLYYK